MPPQYDGGSFATPFSIMGHVPVVERLVKGCCIIKHSIHIRNLRHVPVVERLVEKPCVFKHPGHIRHVGHVPVVEGLVEACV